MPILAYGIKHKVSTGIAYGSDLFPLWEAAIECGATLGELEQIDQGGRFTGKFLSKVVAFHQIRKAIELNVGDAQTTHAEREMKKGQKKRR